jgi:DNA-binding response OmpR family regulator
MAKILIVDDDVQITMLFGRFLTWEGYEVTLLNDSTQALETALEKKPDLFILDLMMPDPDGFKLCRLLRSVPVFKRTPILIVTALNDEDSKVVAYGAGADSYLTKPFKIEELGTSVKDLLDKTR